MRRHLVLFLLWCVWPWFPAAAEVVDRQLAIEAFEHSDRGLRYLRTRQAEDGSWSDSVLVTAHALRAFLESYRRYDESDGAFITRPVGYLLAHVNDDGSIAGPKEDRVRATAAALAALAATKNPAYAEAIAGARRFLATAQLDADEGIAADHPDYGGLGVGSPGLLQQLEAIEALRAADQGAAEGPLWEKAQVFVSRRQNHRATNDRDWAGDDGGFTERPGAASTPLATHAGLAALLFAGVDKGDPRVQAAWNWIRGNYGLEPGLTASHSFAFYAVFAKGMRAYGETLVTGPDGTPHNWRNDLIARLLALYHPDGSWGAEGTPPGYDRELATASSLIALNQVIHSLR